MPVQLNKYELTSTEKVLYFNTQNVFEYHKFKGFGGVIGSDRNAAPLARLGWSTGFTKEDAQEAVIILDQAINILDARTETGGLPDPVERMYKAHRDIVKALRFSLVPR